MTIIETDDRPVALCGAEFEIVLGASGFFAQDTLYGMLGYEVEKYELSDDGIIEWIGPIQDQRLKMAAAHPHSLEEFQPFIDELQSQFMKRVNGGAYQSF